MQFAFTLLPHFWENMIFVPFCTILSHFTYILSHFVRFRMKLALTLLPHFWQNTHFITFCLIFLTFHIHLSHFVRFYPQELDHLLSVLSTKYFILERYPVTTAHLPHPTGASSNPSFFGGAKMDQLMIAHTGRYLCCVSRHNRIPCSPYMRTLEQ
jgi:hypothetical protein